MLLQAIGILAMVLSPADRLEPQPLPTFDGKAWSGLTLGGITDGGIKKRFQIEKGAIRPEGLKIVTTKDSGVRVDALLDGRGEKATMRAIRVAYDSPLDLGKLGEDLREVPVSMYLRERNENWRVVAFIDRGVLAVEVDGRCNTVFLCQPVMVGTALRDFSDRTSPVTAPRDAGDGWDRIIRFNYTSSSVTLGSNKPDGLDADWRRRLGRRMENEAESIREQSLRFSSSGDGRMSISVTSDKFDKDGEANFTVSASLSADSPYGRIDKSASRSRKLGDNYDRKLIQLFNDVAYDLARDLRYAIQRMGPPPKEESRRKALDRVMDGATRKN
jgi:hypothetical protein